MGNELTFYTANAEETRLAAGIVGAAAVGGEAIALIGELGAGKTCFVQGLATGLEVPEESYVRSPSFTILDRHSGRLVLYHADLYRLADPDELVEVGLDDCFTEDAVVAVEWADRALSALPGDHLRVELKLDPGDDRTLVMTATGARHAALLSRVHDRLAGGLG